ncbi:Endonuclease/exonuclease/phosphatase [Rhodocollybia butyracea]|uniref:DNA-(apurinic or apyrimidinic site) endonuclease n=1 Tax=Rhodocollybia butyracea TaxID=206335 RepID=A0A9P5PQR3_9AGAR|nr:Endonuclease/exonuclease/phosphatase [Rhodocollybia butyracea]
MRILTWNIASIFQWNSLKNHDAILDYFQADIINFQEIKSNRASLPATVALPPSYDAYYSFPLTKNGYSGVATYTRKPSETVSGVTALKAEEGLTKLLRQPHLKPPLSDEERISRPEAYDYDDEAEADSIDLKSLDAEGRVLTLDFGLFVLINVYCPNDGGSSEEDTTRFDYKMAFHRLLEARVRTLIKEGREVILLGDLNACAAIIDHCEGNIIMRRGAGQGFGDDGKEHFWVENDARRWLRALLEGDKKCFVDIVRKYHPEREGMFTCWNTKLSARASNYGTRIDYILATPGLLPWIKAGDIEPSLKGSDHCPVWIELYEEIEVSSPNGTSTMKLRDAMLCGSGEKDPPRLATRFWDEHSGKQRLLASFFSAGSTSGKTKAKERVTATAIGSSNSTDSETTQTPTPAPDPSIPSSQDSVCSQTSSQSPSSSISFSNPSKKRKSPPPSLSPTTSISDIKPKKPKADKEVKKGGQSKLSSFFVAPSASGSKGVGQSSVVSSSKKGKSKDSSTIDSGTGGDNEGRAMEVVKENDEELLRAIQLSLSDTPSSSTSSSQEAWKSLLKAPEPPRCVVHNEVAKEFRVNKPGANKGRSFWVCSRPVGPGYDRGRSERPREEVDARWKCNFFVWSSELGTKRAGK